MSRNLPSQPPDSASQPAPPARRALEVLAVFLRFGFTAFGGPAAHIAIMQNELVHRRKWLDDRQFLDLIGVTNLIPGPNSTELAIHIGLMRAGWPGFAAGGLGFVLPAFCMVLGLAWAYVEYGATPQVGGLLYGIKPVVIAIILQALWQMGRKAIKSPALAAISAGVLAAYFAGLDEIALLFGGGLLYVLWMNARRLRGAHLLAFLAPLLRVESAAPAVFRYTTLFLTFFKIGAVMYGSGYVLLAFLRAEFILRLGWLNEQQLLDAVAIGQFTPGPFFTTATFIGYLLGGVKGAVVATLGIFLPSFVLVALSSRFLARFQNHPLTRHILDGIIAAALGLMAAVAWQLGWASTTDLPTLAILLVSGYLLLRRKVNSTWLILGGAAVGLALTLQR